MGIKLLDDIEHEVQLEKLKLLPRGDARLKVYGKSLEELYVQYKKQLADMEETIKSYREVASMIRRRQPLNNGLKYIRVYKSRRVEDAN